MNSKEQNDSFALTLTCTLVLFVFGVMATFFPGLAVSSESSPDPSPVTEESGTPEQPAHMSEALRSSVKKLVVLPGASPANEAIRGSYEKETDGLIGGAAKGSSVGKGVGTDVGGIPVGIPFPILTLPGAVIGGISGKTKREIQEFRDALTEELADAASQPLTNDALASDVFWSLRKVPNLESKVFALTTPIPEDTDAILYVSFSDLTIDVDGKNAVITTSANATLRRLSDGAHVFESEVFYQDRDTLSNWTKDENALWSDYANYARHYIGREISAEVFDRVELRHELRPKATDNVARVKKDDWQGVSKSSSPTLAWELTLLGDDSYGSWVDAIDANHLYYDVEIYDMHRLVYSARQIQASRHTIAGTLEDCKTYRWSVRPSYPVGSDIRFGEWMRFSSDTSSAMANVGRKASEAPAYIQDFASLKIRCGSR
jgi:hypothetical protein